MHRFTVLNFDIFYDGHTDIHWRRTKVGTTGATQDS